MDEAPPEPPPGLPVAAADEGGGRGKRPLLVALVALAVVAVGGTAFALTRPGDGGGESPGAAASATSSDPGSSESATTAVATIGDVTSAVEDAYDQTLSTIDVRLDDDVVTLTGRVYDESTRTDVVDAAAAVDGVARVKHRTPVQSDGERCTEAIRGKDTWACFRAVTWDGQRITADFTSSASTGGAALDLGGSHLHIFGSNVPAESAGTPGTYSTGGGSWRVWDDPTSFEGTLSDIGSPDGVPEALCVRAANGSHQLEQLESGNCWLVTDAS